MGANSPEEYGDYFAWGETQPKDFYWLSTYQYCNGNFLDDPQFTKYCYNPDYGYNGFTDSLITLMPEDDAATTNWGQDWRMPTKEEWEELYNNTTCIWTTQNGVNGCLFTALNGSCLFLPAAGTRTRNSLDYSGDNGYYWSSSLGYPSNPFNEWCFSFYWNGYGTSVETRFCGQSVRPVRSTGQN